MPDPSHAYSTFRRFAFLPVLAAAALAVLDGPPTGAQYRSEISRDVQAFAALPEYGSRLGRPPGNTEEIGFDTLVNGLIAEWFTFYPVRATNAGLHELDDRLRPTSREAVESHVSGIRNYLRQFQFRKSAQMDPERRFDHELLVARLNGELLEYETVRSWARNPSYYVSLVSQGVHSLLKRDFAPLAERTEKLSGRLGEVPRVFADARANLENPPRIYTEIAIAQAKGLVRFLDEIVPAQLASLEDGSVRGTFEERNRVAVEAAREYVAWLENDLLPRSDGDYALGENTYLKKILYEEMVGTPIDELLARGREALAETQEEMRALAEDVKPGATVQEALAALGEETPSGDRLLEETEAGLAEIRAFLVEHEILSVPEKEELRIAETPVYRRALSFASMDSPGIFEANADEAYYYVTPPDPVWDEEKQAEHLGFYNRYQLPVISIHEAYPGHYYQFLSLRQCRSLVRALFGARSNSEGWAHYCEEMMIEEGFGNGDPRMRLAMLNLSLQRICRYLVGISLHTRGMSYEEGVEFFEREGFMARVNAEREARRGTADPTYLVYTLGKWQIYDLREAEEARKGPEFRLGTFHDRLLSFGRAPWKLVREALLATES